ncbi:MAG: hypothetical protein U5L72_15005 [Bacteroidales bacterium]|nr:hypothetical protein [Bacteroidales bacterium]
MEFLYNSITLITCATGAHVGDRSQPYLYLAISKKKLETASPAANGLRCHTGSTVPLSGALDQTPARYEAR